MDIGLPKIIKDLIKSEEKARNRLQDQRQYMRHKFRELRCNLAPLNEWSNLKDDLEEIDQIWLDATLSCIKANHTTYQQQLLIDSIRSANATPDQLQAAITTATGRMQSKHNIYVADHQFSPTLPLPCLVYLVL